MSLQTDAENIADLASRIIKFEILRAQFLANGGVIQVVPGDTDTNVTLNNVQKQGLLALEAGWQTSIKSIVAAWP